MIGWGKIAIGLRVGSGAHPFFVQSWTALLVNGLVAGDQVLEPTAGLPHHYAAEALAKQFMLTPCDTILYVDDDMRFGWNTLNILRVHEAGFEFDIMQALCVSSQSPHEPQVGSPRPQARCVEEVKHCGLAFTLVRRSAIEAVIKAKPKNEMCFTWGMDGKSEDVSFCHKATATGCRCGLDTTVSVGHVLDVVGEWNAVKQKTEFKSFAYMGGARLREVMR